MLYNKIIRRKKILTLVLVDGVCELVETWRNLQSHKKNSLLALESNVLRPFHKSSQVPLRLDVASNPIISWVLREQRAFVCLSTALCSAASNHNLLAFSSFLHLKATKGVNHHVQKVQTLP
jgi:hypothetical protein